MIFPVTKERLRILCTLPFIFYTNEKMSVFTLMKDVYFYNNRLHYFTGENHCSSPIGPDAYIKDTHHGYRLQLEDGMQVMFINLVPVTPEVCAKLSLLGK